ncbi:MAG: hypothetical protein Q9168_003101, partial [Polycauliona sp. 1 TL-2023]
MSSSSDSHSDHDLADTQLLGELAEAADNTFNRLIPPDHFFDALVERLLILLYDLCDRYNPRSEGFRHRILHDIFWITLFIFFAPVLFPLVAASITAYVFYKFIAHRIGTLQIHRSTAKGLRLATVPAILALLLIFFVHSNGGNPPIWSGAFDHFTVLFRHPIISTCSTAGQRIQRLLCPNTLAWLQSSRNPYAILGLPNPSHIKAVSPATAKAAARPLLNLYHPDHRHLHHLPTETSTFIFSLIRSARNILSDSSTRANWDRHYFYGELGEHIDIEVRRRQDLVRRQELLRNIEMWENNHTHRGNGEDMFDNHAFYHAPRANEWDWIHRFPPPGMGRSADNDNNFTSGEGGGN